MGKLLFLRICDYIFVLRPLILIPAWSFFLIGAAEGFGRGSLRHVLFPSPAVSVSLTAILITAYLLNQIFDRQSDERNRKCPFLSSGIFGVRTLIILALLAYAVASYTFRHLEGPGRIPLIAALILSLIYSLPPIRLCARPFVDLLANAAGFGGIAFVLGYGSISGEAMRSSVPYVLLVGATFLHTTILDAAGDKESGKITTSVLIGVRNSRILAVLLHAGAVVASLIHGGMLQVIVTGASFPLSLYALKNTARSSSMQVQGAILLVTLAAVYVWPVYLALLVPLVILSRYYHRQRFGFNYPGFGKKP